MDLVEALAVVAALEDLQFVTILVQGICWLGTKFKVQNDMAAGATGQLEILSTAIMDGWMAGLGAAQPPTTDALGQLSEYARYLYTSQLQHL
ncbi:hypothetical protein SASPL_145327 [Salvia splendens]|uniref:Uncharacterized protein n=1 Tax=Salvia splendens TaxID=180675 RepID=A0A8X8Z7A3_SALSN|nr:hypothetical protein SASPL_145327 [Salvia splendens]